MAVQRVAGSTDWQLVVLVITVHLPAVLLREAYIRAAINAPPSAPATAPAISAPIIVGGCDEPVS